MDLSLIPLLVCVYFVSIFIFPRIENMGQVSWIVLFTIMIAILGLILAKRMINPVINLALETKIIASGNFQRRVESDREDEIGDLGNSINVMTRKIKDYMMELQNYSAKTKEVNLEIQRKVLALSNLLQIGDMIATSEKLENVLNIVVEKAGEIMEDSFTALFLAKDGAVTMLPEALCNITKRELKDISFNIDKDYLGTQIREKKVIKIDPSAKMNAQLEKIRDVFKAKSCLIVPVSMHGKGIGFLISGNKKDEITFKDDDTELIKVLGKQLGIAIENSILSRKAKELAVVDELTGLYNEKYIKGRLDEEIKRAILYQRPCSLLLFNIDNFKDYRDKHGEMATEDLIKRVATVLRDNATEVSKVARLGGDGFAILLPEKNKKEATQLAEDVRKNIEAIGAKLAKKGEKPLTVSGGVSENPIDGTTSRELFDKAVIAMKKAKLEGKNRIST